MATMLSAAVLSLILPSAFAECPNACNGHGTCGAFDMCSCYRNWMANDCSQRVCQFGFSHVDTPIGDIDSSSGPLTVTNLVAGAGGDAVPYSSVGSYMWPKGVSERFPYMADSAQNLLSNTAHWYSECSNKGICDREIGQCQCFDTYSGSACQRSDCPVDDEGRVCSGNGICADKATIAAKDYSHVYKLWDEHMFFGCMCDGGYTGPDCSLKNCKYGVDPMYEQGAPTARYSNWTYAITTLAANDPVVVTGNYSLVYTDTKGVKWLTKPIDILAGCRDVVNAFETIPNDVIPGGTMNCLKWTADSVEGAAASVFEPVDTSHRTMHTKFTITFPQNPGITPMISIHTAIDANRQTLYTDETTSTLGWFIFNNGFYGEDDDWVPDLCEGIKVSFSATTDPTSGLDQLATLSAADLKTFKKCLGDVNGDETDNVDLENWDHGTATQPHLIKLVDATQDLQTFTDTDLNHHNTPYQHSLTYLCKPGDLIQQDGLCEYKDPAGFYAVIYFDSGLGEFLIYGRPSADYSTSTTFHVFTTTGHLDLVEENVQIFNTWNDETDGTTSSQADLLTNKIYTKARSGTTRENLDCETSTAGQSCLERGDYIMLLNIGYAFVDHTNALTTAQHDANPIYPQIYKVEKAQREIIPLAHFASAEPSTNDWSTAALTPTFVQNQILLDKAVNARFHLDVITAASDTSASAFRFTPPTNAYKFAAPCSRRGVCNVETGDCECFNGYTGDVCKDIDVLAGSSEF